MPYAPPNTSPSSVTSTSPIKSSSSYAGLRNSQLSPTATKQSPLSRSQSAILSSEYIRSAHHHHRRSSGPTSSPRVPIPVAAFAKNRQSPKHPSAEQKTNSSSTSSSDDEEGFSMYSRRGQLRELRESLAVQLPQRKTPSPPGSPDHRYISTAMISCTDSIPPLDTDNIHYDPTASDGEHSSSTTPPDDNIECRRILRKKSGELVKPSLKTPVSNRRPMSLPSTPIYPKAVHFDVKLEYVRHFWHSEKPIAVSNDTSPAGEDDPSDEFPFETEHSNKTSEKQYQVELPNFPTEDQLSQRDLPIRVDSVYLASNGQSLIGKVLVKNIAYHKWVVVRFTFDNWQTMSEVSATYDSSQNTGTDGKEVGWDGFVFNVKLEDFLDLENRRMIFCVRYNVADQEFWDNNYGSNYLVEFRKRPNYLLRRASRPPKANDVSGGSDDAVIGDDFDIELTPESFAKNLAQQIKSPESALLANLGECSPFARKPTATSSPSAPPGPVNGVPQEPTGKTFANRYDFAASLSAAIANANAFIGFEGRGLRKPHSPKQVNTSDAYFAPINLSFRQSQSVQTAEELNEDNLFKSIKKSHLSALQQAHHFRSRSYPLGSTQSANWSAEDGKDGHISDEGTEKPPVDSSSYQDFINSYCFFEPGKSEIPRSTPSETNAPQPAASNHGPQPNIPSIRATKRSPPPSPRKLSPVRTKSGVKPGTDSSVVEHSSSSDNYHTSTESSTTSTPRSTSPPIVRSPQRSREHSRDSSPPMRFHHHHHASHFGLGSPGAASAAVAS